MNKSFIKVIRPLIAFALLAVLFAFVDFETVIAQYRNINWLILVPILLYVPALYLSTIRWMLVLPKVHLSTSKLFVNYWISNFFSQFLPSSIGGDSYRIVSLRKVYGTAVIARSVFFDRFSGLVAILLIGAPSVLLIGKSFFDLKTVLVLFLVGVPICILLAVFVVRSNFFAKHIVFLTETFHLFKKNSVPSIALSLVYLSLGAFSLWIYFIMFGYQFNFFTVLSIYSVLQLISLLPISINGIGVNEAALVFFFTALGVPAEVSLGIAILGRFVMLGQTGVGGVLYLLTPHRTRL